jgi:hypothetical protein
MSVLLDIFGSTFIGGMLLLLIIKLNLFTSQASFSSDNELKMQQNAKTLAEIMNYDFRKIGYNHNGTAITIADADRLEFWADLEPPDSTGHGTIDYVRYYLKDESHASGTSNQGDIVLVRRVNNEPEVIGPSLGLVKLEFSYLDSLSIPTADLSKIKYIKTSIWIEPTDPANNFITGNKDSVFTYWEFTIYPRNI